MFSLWPSDIGSNILLFYPLKVNLLPGKELKKFLKMISDSVPFAKQLSLIITSYPLDIIPIIGHG
jgi:hypothetical protein